MDTIDFQYTVEFEDGIRPKVCVYGIEHETGKGFVAGYFIGLSIAVGYEIEPLDEQKPGIENDSRQEWYYTAFQFTDATTFRENPIPTDPKWEQIMKEECKKNGFNGIRVQGRDQIESAFKWHTKQYKNQFNGLSDKLSDTFRAFIAEHPGLGYDIEF